MLLAAGGVVKATHGGGRRTEAGFAPFAPGPSRRARPFDGFCLLNNALAAYAQRRVQADRILILDWDVPLQRNAAHLLPRPVRAVISLHGHPNCLYPGTGWEEETGEDRGRGYTMNIPFLPAATDEMYRQAFHDRVIPAIGRFAPQFVLLSVGYDAHGDDPIGNLDLTDEAFAWMTETMIGLAEAHADGRFVSVLEGGYNLHEALRGRARAAAGGVKRDDLTRRVS